MNEDSSEEIKKDIARSKEIKKRKKSSYYDNSDLEVYVIMRNYQNKINIDITDNDLEELLTQNKRQNKKNQEVTTSSPSLKNKKIKAQSAPIASSNYFFEDDEDDSEADHTRFPCIQRNHIHEVVDEYGVIDENGDDLE